MKLVFSLSLLIVTSNLFACEFLPKQNIISLSGPAIHFFFNLGLINDKRLKIISKFSGFTDKDFNGELVAGGIFLSSKLIKKHKNSLIIFDNSREQRRAIKRSNIAGYLEVDTAGDPFVVYQKLKKQLMSLTTGCQKNILKLQKQVDLIKTNISSLKNKDVMYLFYLGKVINKRRPQLLMLNDGFVKYLIINKKINSYPSKLTYVSWSSKIIRNLEKKGKVIHVGLNNIRKHKKQSIYQVSFDQKGQNINVYGPSLLIPGLPQIFFLKDLVDLFKKKEISVQL